MKRQIKKAGIILLVVFMLILLVSKTVLADGQGITPNQSEKQPEAEFKPLQGTSDKKVIIEALPEGSLPYSFDIDMPIEHQQYAMAMCEEYGIDVDIFFSLMYHESRYTADACNGSDYGYCQINKVNWKWLANDYGLDVKNPLDNIESGTLMLSAYLTKANGDYAHALTGYNTGSVKYVNEYARKVLKGV